MSISSTTSPRLFLHSVIRSAAVLSLLVIMGGCATASKPRPVVAPKWSRFERIFQSPITYPYPVQDVTLTVEFTSPLGETTRVDGFWDGGTTWRVRFAPDQIGRWFYRTVCSDEANKGLNNQRGQFECTAPVGKTRFEQHGPVRVARDGRHLEHQDGTPFFWLADTGWNAALLSTPEEWDFYLAQRTRQKFTAIQWVTTQWRAAPAGDRENTLAYDGTAKIAINPQFFQRLDAKVDTAARVGLLNVPVLLWAIPGGSNPRINPGVSLPDDQAIALARYMVARWGAWPVVWILGGDGDYRGEKAEKWKRIGRAVFGDRAHAPVVMHPGGRQWVWNEFKDEPWASFIGYQSGHGSDDATLRWTFDGPPAKDWVKPPAKPFINLEPCYENHLSYQSKQPLTADDVRRSIYWSLLCAPTAGVTYGGHGVWGWDDGTQPPTDHAGSGIPKRWQEAIFMPAAEQMPHLAAFFNSIEFWRLRPAPELVVNQPGVKVPKRQVAAARTEAKDLVLFYVPEDRTIEIKMEALPPNPKVEWYNPRDGKTHPAVAVLSTDTVQLPTPDNGDWLLVLKSEKQ